MCYTSIGNVFAYKGMVYGIISSVERPYYKQGGLIDTVVKYTCDAATIKWSYLPPNRLSVYW